MTANTMLKWCECAEGDTLYEVFLPGHDRDAQAWLLRASRRGHVLAERHISIVWRPRFGPDQGDVLYLEAGLERLIGDLGADHETPEADGPYIPGLVEIEPPNSYLHAALQAQLGEYASAAATLGITESMHSQLLDLPAGYTLEGLYPIAVTPKRSDRMRRLVALQRVLQQFPTLEASRETLLAAVMIDDVAAIRQTLEDAGVPM